MNLDIYKSVIEEIAIGTGYEIRWKDTSRYFEGGTIFFDKNIIEIRISPTLSAAKLFSIFLHEISHAAQRAMGNFPLVMSIVSRNISGVAFSSVEMTAIVSELKACEIDADLRAKALLAGMAPGTEGVWSYFDDPKNVERLATYIEYLLLKAAVEGL